MPAVPIITAVASVGSAIDSHNKQKKALKQYNDSLLTREEAERQAEDTLSGLYDKHLEKTLNALDKGAAIRGFYGQAPEDAYKRSTAAQIQADKSSAIADLATQMQGQTAAQAYQQAQLSLQSAQQQANQQYQQALATGSYPTGTGLWGALVNIASNWNNLFPKQNQSVQPTTNNNFNYTMSPTGQISLVQPKNNMVPDLSITDYSYSNGVNMTPLDFGSLLRNKYYKG